MPNLKSKRNFFAFILGLFSAILFYIVLVVLVVSTVKFVIGGYESNTVEWPVNFIFNERAEDFLIDQSIAPIELNPKSSLRVTQGIMNFYSIDWPYHQYVILCLDMLKFMIWLFILYLLKNVFKSVEYGMPLNSSNYRMINYIALGLLCWYFRDLLYTVINHWYIINYEGLTTGEYISKLWSVFAPVNDLRPSNGGILLHNSHSMTLVYCAACLFVVAAIYKEGLRLKHDSESIV